MINSVPDKNCYLIITNITKKFITWTRDFLQSTFITNGKIMFEHSIKVPHIYKTAAKVAQQVKEEGASLKDLIYKLKHSNIKAIYALVSTLLKKSNTLDYLIRSTQILIKENRLDPWLTRILITELLWGKKRLPNINKPCQTIINYYNELTDCLATFSDDVPSKETNKVKKPRYVRINTLKLTTAEAVDIFRDEGWTLLRCGDNSDYGSFLATVASLSDDQFIVDMHVKDLLIFPPNTQFYKHYLYLNGGLILQDKASCLAPLFLSPEPKSSVLDMCAAPGMKASQLAVMVGTKGIVYAVERDQRRYKTLVQLMENMSATNVKCINKDVLTITEREFPNVEYILVDPSCSGSGMLDRPEFEDPGSKCNKSRLESLAGFQITILRHALNNFPKAKRVVYSTCSIYPEENESVIEQVISTVKNFKLVDLKEKMQSKWFNFGSDKFGAIGQRCMYTKSEQDYTNGFFIALFERLNNEETNEFFVKRVKRSSECGANDNQDSSNGNKENDDINITKSKKKKKNKNKINKNEKEMICEKIPEKIKTKNNGTSKINSELISIDSELKLKHKKKFNKNKDPSLQILPENISDESKGKQKKKSKKPNETLEYDESKSEDFTQEETGVLSKTKQKKKKKSKKNKTRAENEEITEQEKFISKNNDIIVSEKKKLKRKHDITECDILKTKVNEEEIKMKKKKKSKCSE